MMTLEKFNEGYKLSVTHKQGVYEFFFSNEARAFFAKELSKENVASVAAGELELRFGDILIEEADDDPKYESRLRILFHAGERKWHLTQEETIQLGDKFRSLN